MTRRTRQTELDGLRLIGLGRIPACSRCPRYHDLVGRYLDAQPCSAPLAAIPASCEHPYCAPLAVRYGSSDLPMVPQYAAS